ncbi:P-loop containing nucleoside triphosphate hydrolase protein [Boletus edulis BED1]|uniref:P-loop containing nucleoside triphosphate hydrolase protein n=1 Tax=Boletus edulis BED1 TaxID=1328754 RepID=A0AAD4C0P6_BOLED|nr:P-loop containing nucleoside triphosphate hydrolase protein [Boletus edulis BED1]
MSQRKRASRVPVVASTTQNIVVFGESGVGKSSLINLIAGRSIAATSSGAKGCTFRHKKYELQVDDTPYAIWDTAGLDEGAFGTVPAEIAEVHLKQLLHDLTRANGIHLLVYCVRASRLRKTLLSNYNLFYSAICRKKVPIVAVVTGLENYEEEMQDWWAANETEFAMLKMHFDGHACVTTLDADKVNSPILKQRCHASRRAVLPLIASTCARDRWGTEQDGWVSAALADVRAMFKPPRQNTTQPTPIVALYDLPARSLDPIGSVKDTSFEGGHLVDVGGSPLLVYRIRDQHLRSGVRFKKQIASRGADLLIFCTSIHSDTGASRRRAAAFHGSYGGDMRPLLVVVRDAPSDESAYEWWHALDDVDLGKEGMTDNAGKLQAIVRALPPSDNAEARRTAVARLQRTIQTRSLQPVEVAPTGCFGWLMGGRRPAKLKLGTGSTMVMEDALSRCEVWVPWPARRL